MIERSHTTGDPDLLKSVFRETAFVTLNRGMTKKQAFMRLLKVLAQSRAIPSDAVPLLVDALLAKERSGSCGLGNGLAFPHLRTRLVKVFTGAIGTAPDGLDFDSLDDHPTRLVILLLSPYERREEHLEIMGRLAALLHDHTLPYWLHAARAPKALLDYLE